MTDKADMMAWLQAESETETDMRWHKFALALIASQAAEIDRLRALYDASELDYSRLHDVVEALLEALRGDTP
jgi:hypothetical protein